MQKTNSKALSKGESLDFSKENTTEISFIKPDQLRMSMKWKEVERKAC